MNILFLSTEVAPFSTVGGLSQVSYFLPRALLKLGLDVRIFTPKYGSVDGTAPNFPGTPKVAPKRLKMEVENLSVPIIHHPSIINHQPSIICNVKSFRLSPRDPLVYFLENREYYEQRANVYGYADDHVRFALLSKGCLEWLLAQRTRMTKENSSFVQHSTFNIQHSTFNIPLLGFPILSTATIGIPVI